MIERELTVAAKSSNIIDMALTFSAVIRLFRAGSKGKIAKRLDTFSSSLAKINSVDDFEERHKEFCNWFCCEIFTAPKAFKNGRKKESRPASYGQAAKILDVVLKVYIFYCSEPSLEMAARIRPFLHAPIDTQIMNYLKKRYPDTQIEAGIFGVEPTQLID